ANGKEIEKLKTDLQAVRDKLGDTEQASGGRSRGRGPSRAGPAGAGARAGRGWSRVGQPRARGWAVAYTSRSRSTVTRV
ncbi:hypothetical protein AB0B83_26195, partial [Micromonospora sp. NPDC049060]